ncbi:MAG: hypothetical protein J6V66_00740 [Clostridia bacterium]|nr:hypothetical protein [Clostridia bacterium]
MALFGNKKLTLDEILKGIDELAPEDKDKVKEKLQDLNKAEDEREIDKIEEEKADDVEVKDEKKDEKEEETEEIGKDVDEVEDEVKDDEPIDKPVVETEEEAVETKTPEETEKGDNYDERLSRIESDVAEIKQILAVSKKEPKEVDSSMADKLSELDRKFNG